MKKYFLSIVALAGMLFATSCQESLVEPQMDGTTTFTIEIPGQMGTKALNETYNLYVEVYKDNGTDRLQCIGFDEDLTITSGSSTTFSLDLVATQEYDIVFWAQKAGAYGVDNKLTNVDMDIKNHHNSEGGAAYYAILNNFKPSEDNPSVSLKRPFAQLNIGTLLEVSYSNSPMTINDVEITVSEVASEFNRVDFDGTMGVGQEPVIYVADGNPYSAKVSTIEVNHTEYSYVSMDYLPVVGNQALVDVIVKLNVTDPNNVSSEITRTITSVPLQMNYKTNIVGNLITSTTDFTVTIDENWEGTDINKEVEFREVATAEELQDAIEAGVDNITLTDDIELTGTLEFKPVQGPNPIARTSTNETSFVLDLGGNTITTSLESDGRHYYAINNYANLTIIGQGAINARGIKNFGTMTIDGNITITNVDTNGGAAIWNEGDVTINGGTFISGNPGTIVEDSYGAALNTRPTGGNVIVNGGTFIAYSQLTYAIINEGEKTIINNAIVKGRHGAVAGTESSVTKIYGGSFEQTGVQGQSDHCIYYASAIYGGKFKIEQPTDAGGRLFYHEGKPSPIAEGYTAVVGVDGWTYVVPGENFDALVNNADQLAEAVAAGKTNILLADGEYDVRNCGGKTLTLTGMSKNAVLKVYNEGEDGCDYGFGDPQAGVGDVIFNGLTINTTSNTGNYKGYAYMKGTFNNCDFIGAYSLNNFNDFDFNNCTFDFQNGYFWTWGAKSVTFDGCTFNGNSKNILAHGTSPTEITINGCTFAAKEKGYTGAGDNTACVEIDPAGNNTYTIYFCGENTKTEFYAGWTRIKDNSTGHNITEPN